jgi:hypothetical protein
MSARRNEVITLKAETRYKLHGIKILKALTIKGQPGSVIELSGGQILIDLSNDPRAEEKCKNIIAY